MVAQALCRDGVDLTNFVRVWHTDGVCYVVANFLNGAMSTTQGKRLEALLKEVGERDNVDAVVFAGGYDAFANGLILTPLLPLCVTPNASPIALTPT